MARAREGNVMSDDKEAVSRRLKALGKEKREAARKSASIVPTVRWHYGAWQFLLSYDGAVRLWVFSAMLYPRGRGSVRDDWEILGMMTSAVGSPPGNEAMGDTLRTSPNAVHKWMWQDPPEPTPAEEKPS